MKKLLVLTIFINLLFANAYIDNISFQKVVKLVEKEELIAKAYKEYLMKFGKEPSDLDILVNNSSLIPSGFSSLNFFSKTISLKTLNLKAYINSQLPTLLKDKVNVYEYYYSNENRKYTLAPIDINSDAVKIKLSIKEKYILEFKNQITRDKDLALNKYYLDDSGILHWYDLLGNYKFSYGDNLIIHSSVPLFNDITGALDPDFKALFANKKVLYAGLEIFHMQEDKALEYLDLGEKGNIIKVGDSRRELGKTILKFTRRAGGMIVNGDIYTWGNNANSVVGIGNNNYTTKDGSAGIGYPVVNTLVKAKALTYDPLIDSKRYFSSPLRPKFVDFTSDVWHSTCGVTTKGELYCAGPNVLEQNFIDFQGYTRTSRENMEYLYRSSFFNGTTNEIKKVFSLLSTYIALGKPITDELPGYLVYYWGNNNKYGYGATSNKNEKKVRTPSTVSNKRFKDISYTISVGYRRIAGVTPDGDIYTWGLDNQITNMGNCNQNIDGQTINFCEPVRLDSNINFTSVLGGQQGFIAKNDSGEFFRITQPKESGQGTLAKVENINDLIKNHEKYDSENDVDIISVDLSSKLTGSTLEYGKGIVWVNSKKELKGDYFTSENVNDEFFKEAINRIKWKMIRVIEDQNGMCGIDENNQMYCWGDMTFFGAANAAGNTFMLPMFTANLHDEDKDFLVAEGGETFEGSSNVTNMTSGEWVKGTKNEYFIKYPTYFGGFNYEFEFK